MSCPSICTSTAIGSAKPAITARSDESAWRKRIRALLLVTITTALVACGGGGSDATIVTPPVVGGGGAGDPGLPAVASKDVVYNQNGYSFGGAADSIWAVVDKDGVFRMVGQRTSAGVTQTLIALGDGSTPMNLTASGALSGANCYQHWEESSCAGAQIQLSASGNISVNRPVSGSLGALMFQPQMEKLTAIVTPTTSSLVGVFGDVTRSLTISEAGGGVYNMVMVSGALCNLQGQISGLGTNTMKLTNVKFTNSAAEVCPVSNTYTLQGTAFIDRVGGLDYFNMVIDCQPSSCDDEGYLSIYTYVGPKLAE